MTSGMGMGPSSEHNEQPSEAMQQVRAESKKYPMDMEFDAIVHEIDENQRMIEALQAEQGEAAEMSDEMTLLKQRRFRLELAKKAKQPAEVGQTPESANA